MMNDNSKLFKYLSIPGVFLTMLLALACYMAWEEIKINDDLIDQAIKGNQIAVEILIKYEKPWKLDGRLIHEALGGNMNAIRVLGITPPKN